MSRNPHLLLNSVENSLKLLQYFATSFKTKIIDDDILAYLTNTSLFFTKLIEQERKISMNDGFRIY